jgi:hypothetical protein
MVVVFSNCVRVTFSIAPSRKKLLEFESDFLVVKVEASPFERAFDCFNDTEASCLLTKPQYCASFLPFKADYANES